MFKIEGPFRPFPQAGSTGVGKTDAADTQAQPVKPQETASTAAPSSGEKPQTQDSARKMEQHLQASVKQQELLAGTLGSGATPVSHQHAATPLAAAAAPAADLTGDQVMDDLKGMSPQITEHLKGLGIAKIELKAADEHLVTGAYYNQKDKSIVVKYDGSQKASEVMDNVLFETCNGQNEAKFKELDRSLGNKKITLAQYGQMKSDIEFNSSRKYVDLIKTLPESSELAKDLPFQAQRALGWADKVGYAGPAATKEEIETARSAFNSSPHDQFAPQGSASSLPTPQTYTYEKIQNLSSSGLMGQLQVLKNEKNVSHADWDKARASLGDFDNAGPVEKAEKYQKLVDDLRAKYDPGKDVLKASYDLTPQMTKLLVEQKQVLGMKDADLSGKVWAKFQEAGGSRTDFDAFADRNIKGFETLAGKEKLAKFGDIVASARALFPEETKKALFKPILHT